MYKDGATYLLVIEWDTGEKPDPDDLEPEGRGAYEYACRSAVQVITFEA